MTGKENAGYREIAHTADWELHVWGPDMPALMEKAALGMYTLSGTRLAQSPRISRIFEIPLQDRESILVDFLSELIFLAEDLQIGFDHFDISLDGDCFHIQADGAPVTSQTKEIKAVTYHQLQVRETNRGLEVNIVFDV